MKRAKAKIRDESYFRPPNGYCGKHVKRKPPRHSGTCGSNAYFFHDGESYCRKHKPKQCEE